MKRATLWIILVLPGCASLGPRGRIFLGATSGAAMGSVGGALLSPNRESRTLNALVFGLAGALTGGLAAVLTGTAPKSQAQTSLRDRDSGAPLANRSEYLVPQSGDIPEFVKKRLRPAVIEEYEESDSITEDGALEAPHKVYRIKQPAQLVAKPIPGEQK